MFKKFKKLTRKVIKKLQNLVQFLCAQMISIIVFFKKKNLDPIVASDFVLEIVGNLEYQPPIAGAGCLFTGL